MLTDRERNEISCYVGKQTSTCLGCVWVPWFSLWLSLMGVAESQGCGGCIACPKVVVGVLWCPKTVVAGLQSCGT